MVNPYDPEEAERIRREALAPLQAWRSEVDAQQAPAPIQLDPVMISLSDPEEPAPPMGPGAPILGDSGRAAGIPAAISELARPREPALLRRPPPPPREVADDLGTPGTRREMRADDAQTRDAAEMDSARGRATRNEVMGRLGGLWDALLGGGRRTEQWRQQIAESGAPIEAARGRAEQRRAAGLQEEQAGQQRQLREQQIEAGRRQATAQEAAAAQQAAAGDPASPINQGFREFLGTVSPEGTEIPDGLTVAHPATQFLVPHYLQTRQRQDEARAAAEARAAERGEDWEDFQREQEFRTDQNIRQTRAGHRNRLLENALHSRGLRAGRRAVGEAEATPYTSGAPVNTPRDALLASLLARAEQADLTNSETGGLTDIINEIDPEEGFSRGTVNAQILSQANHYIAQVESNRDTEAQEQIPGMTLREGVQLTPAQAERMRDVATTYNRIHSNVEELGNYYQNSSLAERAGGVAWSTFVGDDSQLADAKRAARNLQNLYRDLAQWGALTGNEAQMADVQLPQPESISGVVGNAMNNASSLLRSAGAMVRSYAAARGYELTPGWYSGRVSAGRARSAPGRGQRQERRQPSGERMIRIELPGGQTGAWPASRPLPAGAREL